MIAETIRKTDFNTAKMVRWLRDYRSRHQGEADPRQILMGDHLDDEYPSDLDNPYVLRQVVDRMTGEFDIPSPESDTAFIERLRACRDYTTGSFSESEWPDIPDDMDAVMESAVERAPNRLKKAVRNSLFPGGKRLRPRLAYLGYAFGDRERPIAPLMAMLEMSHTASLIYDDIIDRSDLRRGTPSVFRRLGSGGAVQCGDYLLLRVLELSRFYVGTGINRILLETVKEMCEGELAQLESSRDRDVTIDDCLTCNEKKTAVLMAVSCSCGALASGAEKRVVDRLHSYGWNLGMAFQLMDDLRDVCSMTVGKPSGIDEECGLVTLPLLKGTEYAMNMANDFCREAQNDAEQLPGCAEREALLKLADDLLVM